MMLELTASVASSLVHNIMMLELTASVASSLVHNNNYYDTGAYGVPVASGNARLEQFSIPS